MFAVYVWMDGADFDADSFHQSIGAKLGGTVVARKQIRNGAVESAGRYWKSNVVEVADDPEDALHELLVKLAAEVATFPKLPGVRLVAEIVEEVENAESIKGFFFSTETIRLLAQLRAGLDIDIVRRLGKTS